MPSLIINGTNKETEAVTLEELFQELSLPVSLLLVEYNGTALHRSEWPAVRLSGGDRLELMQVAAGG